MPKTLSIGGATFDLFLDVPATLIGEDKDNRGFHLPLGKKISIDNVIGTCGGGAHNTSVGLSRLGCDASFSGIVGSDQWGDIIQKNLETEGVDTNNLTVIEGEATSFSMILREPRGERTILTHKHMDRHLHDVTFDREAAKSMDAIFLNRVHQDTCEIEDDILQMLVDAPSIHLTWNPGGHHIEEGLTGPHVGLLAHTDLLLLNKEEALAFTKTDEVTHAMKSLIDAGAKIVCVTDGANGSMATDGTTLYRCPAIACDVVDMTGAGDAFGTAMTWALLTGKDLPTALKTGTINAMSVVGVVGAQQGLLTETQIQTQLAKTDSIVTQESF